MQVVVLLDGFVHTYAVHLHSACLSHFMPPAWIKLHERTTPSAQRTLAGSVPSPLEHVLRFEYTTVSENGPTRVDFVLYQRFFSAHRVLLPLARVACEHLSGLRVICERLISTSTSTSETSFSRHYLDCVISLRLVRLTPQPTFPLSVAFVLRKPVCPFGGWALILFCPPVHKHQVI